MYYIVVWTDNAESFYEFDKLDDVAIAVSNYLSAGYKESDETNCDNENERSFYVIEGNVVRADVLISKSRKQHLERIAALESELHDKDVEILRLKNELEKATAEKPRWNVRGFVHACRYCGSRIGEKHKPFCQYININQITIEEE